MAQASSRSAGCSTVLDDVGTCPCTDDRFRPALADPAPVASAGVVDDRYQYLALLAACLLVTLPLEVILGARVWRQPRRLVRTVAPVAAMFCVWDVVAIADGWWHYSPRYTTGWELPGDLPAEELAFFVVVPVCAILTLEGVRAVLRGAGRR
jgi:lycopene beta-cyclase